MPSLKLLDNCDFTTVEKIKKETVFFTNLLSGVKYMISGSSILSIMYMNKPEYNDFDLYFYNKKHLKSACNILKKSKHFKLLYKSSYASTYFCKKNEKQIQLVYQTKTTAWHLANSHDFVNCAVVYTPHTGSLYVSQKAKRAWQTKKLVINKSPLMNPNYPNLRFFNLYSIFILRIRKYKARYNLQLDSSSKALLKKIHQDYQNRLKNLPIPIKSVAYLKCPYSGFEYAFKDVLNDFQLQDIL